MLFLQNIFQLTPLYKHNTKIIDLISTLMWHAFYIQLIRQIQLNWVEDRDSGGDWRKGQKRRSELNTLTYWCCLFDKGRAGQNWAINLPVSRAPTQKLLFSLEFLFVYFFMNALLIFRFCRWVTSSRVDTPGVSHLIYCDLWCEVRAVLVCWTLA